MSNKSGSKHKKSSEARSEYAYVLDAHSFDDRMEIRLVGRTVETLRANTGEN